MKIIPLTQNKVALVDDIDFPILNKWKWQTCMSKHTCYARRVVREKDGKRKNIYMHRELLDVLDNKNILVDHEDGNGLNNQRKNIRLATYQQNKANSYHRESKSGYKGVFNRNGSWVSVIKVDYIPRYLGIFKNKIDAVKAYTKASKKYFGEFARV